MLASWIWIVAAVGADGHFSRFVHESSLMEGWFKMAKVIRRGHASQVVLQIKETMALF